jgi:hypothetical protein
MSTDLDVDAPKATRHFRAVDAQGEELFKELDHFAAWFGLNSLAPGRLSFLLLLQLFGGFKSQQASPYRVIAEIKALEGGRPSRMKPPTQFTRQVLAGLWHQHYLPEGLPALAINLQNGLRKHGLPWFERKIAEAEASGVEQYVTEDDIKHIVHDAVHGNLERRSADQAWTGEWIIYAQHDGARYYLSLGGHTWGDENIRAQIDSICCREFPFLEAILPKAA